MVYEWQHKLYIWLETHPIWVTKHRILTSWPQATIFMTSHPLYFSSYPLPHYVWYHVNFIWHHIHSLWYHTTLWHHIHCTLLVCLMLEKGMANHFGILALRIPWTVWKAKRYDTVRWTPKVSRCLICYWRNNSRKNEEIAPMQKQRPVLGVTGGGSKVWCDKKQYCIGTWNVVKSGHWHFRDWKVVAEWLDTGFLASGGDEFNLGPETRLDHSELLCNKFY